MRKLGQAAASITGVFIALLAFARPANAWDLMQLADTQLDKIAAGLSANATGTGAAGGSLSGSEASITTTAVGVEGGVIATAVGLVASSGSSTTSSGVAIASSILRLSITLP
jgi:hypothetical protein